jgi:hypothetical protein
MPVIKPSPAKTPSEKRIDRIMSLARANAPGTPESAARALDRPELEKLFATAVDVITCMDYALLSAHVTRGDLVDIANGRR